MNVNMNMYMNVNIYIHININITCSPTRRRTPRRLNISVSSCPRLRPNPRHLATILPPLPPLSRHGPQRFRNRWREIPLTHRIITLLFLSCTALLPYALPLPTEQQLFPIMRVARAGNAAEEVDERTATTP